MILRCRILEWSGESKLFHLLLLLWIDKYNVLSGTQMFVKYILLFTVVCPNNRGFCGSSLHLARKSILPISILVPCQNKPYQV